MIPDLIFRRVGLLGTGALMGFLAGRILEALERGAPEEKERSRHDASLGFFSPHLPSGANFPSHENVFVRHAYTCSINYRTKTPNWVAEHLKFSQPDKKNGDRKRASFRSDEDIPDAFRAHNRDYWDSGWSRGHLAASASHRTTQDEQDSTFLLNSNIVPQDMSMNGCDWNRVEVLVRDLVKKFGDVYVLSGPLWIPESRPGISQRPFTKNKVIVHEVVGDSSVHVPTHLFKAIRVEDPQGIISSCAFILPNTFIAEEKSLDSYVVSIDEVEKLTGLDFSGMKSNNDLCSSIRCDRKENRRMRGWRIYGLIDDARSVDELRVAVRKAIEEGYVDSDNFLIPKIIRDRMIDIELLPDPVNLFPDEEHYRLAVERGFENFLKRPIPTDALS